MYQNLKYCTVGHNKEYTPWHLLRKVYPSISTKTFTQILGWHATVKQMFTQSINMDGLALTS